MCKILRKESLARWAKTSRNLVCRGVDLSRSFAIKMKSHCFQLTRIRKLPKQSQACLLILHPLAWASIQTLTSTWLATVKSEWPFGLQWVALGKFFSRHSFQNSNSAAAPCKTACQGNSISISVGSPRGFLNSVILWIPLGFHDSYQLSKKKVINVSSYRFQLSPLAAHQTWKQEVSKGRQ